MNHRGGTKNSFARKLAKTIPILFIAVTIGLQVVTAIRFKKRKSKKMASSNSTIVSLDDEYQMMTGDQSWSSNMLGSLCCSSCLDTFNFDGQADFTTPIIEGSAFDVIVVEGEDGRLFQNSDFLVTFKGGNEIEEDTSHKIVMEVDQGNDKGTKAWFPIIRRPLEEVGNDETKSEDCDDENDFDEKKFWGCCHPSAGAARPNMLSKFNDSNVEAQDDPSSALKAFLKPGRNPIRYLLLDDLQVVGVAQANIFLWKYSDSIVVSDIDGTITRTNVQGVMGTIVTENYDQVCHDGICNMLSRLSSTSRVMYVTSRPIALVNHTRRFLSSLKQGNATLPDGPLLGFGGNMAQLLVMELVSKTTQRFKAGKLWQQVVQPFRQATGNNLNYPNFVASFGNNFMDVQSYHAVGVNLDRIFKISKKSKIVTFDKPSMISQSYNGTLDFPPHQWYKDRIGTVFDGYTDSDLNSQLYSG